MPIRVLIAEADESLRTAYRTALAREGFEVVTAKDGLECVGWLRRRPPDVLVLGNHLLWGGPDGVLALVREHVDVPTVPVIVIVSGDGRYCLNGLAGVPVRGGLTREQGGRLLAASIRALANDWPRRGGLGRQGDGRERLHA